MINWFNNNILREIIIDVNKSLEVITEATDLANLQQASSGYKQVILELNKTKERTLTSERTDIFLTMYESKQNNKWTSSTVNLAAEK